MENKCIYHQDLAGGVEGPDNSLDEGNSEIHFVELVFNCDSVSDKCRGQLLYIVKVAAGVEDKELRIVVKCNSWRTDAHQRSG